MHIDIVSLSLRELDAVALATNATVSMKRDTRKADRAQHSQEVTIPAIGIVHGEIFSLQELAEDCADDGVYAFFFCAPPLVITHGTGSPINPQAIK